MGLFPFYYHKLTLLGQALKINKGIKKSRKKRHIETSSLGSNQKTKCCNYADFEDLRMQVYIKNASVRAGRHGQFQLLFL